MNAKFVLLVLGMALLLAPSFLYARGACASCDTPSQCDAGLTCQGGNLSTPGEEGTCLYTDPSKVVICNPLQADSFTDIISNVMNFLFGVAIVFTPIMVVFAGFLFLTAGGNPAQFTKARGILLWTAVGFGVILLARGLTSVLQKIIGV